MSEQSNHVSGKHFWRVTFVIMAIHFFGIFVTTAVLNKMGCEKPFLEQPDFCMYKGGVGFWEAIVIYHGVYWVVDHLWIGDEDA